MAFLSNLRADLAKRYPSPAPSANGRRRNEPEPEPPGGFSFGTTWYGGPLSTDVYGAKRAPSPTKLIEKYQTLVYALVARKRDAVTRVPLRLYADGSRAQGGKPRSACDPIRVSRHVGTRLARAGAVSYSAVDQVYEIRNHPILDRLDQPDPYGYFTRVKLLGLICSYQDVIGSAFLVPEGNGWDWRQEDRTRTRPKGPPEFLWVIYPQYVVPVRHGGSPLIREWRYFRDGIPFDSTLWFRQSISLRDAYGAGYSPTYAGDLYSDQEGRFLSTYDQVLGIGARPNMAVTARDATLAPGDVEAKRFEQDLNRRFAGPGAGGIVINRGAWEFTPLSYPPTDMGALELAEYDRNTLAAIFGVPPTYFTTDTNLANLQAADEQMARYGVEPMCKSIADTLTQLVRTWDPRLMFQFDPVVEEDEESKMKVIEMRLKNGLTTPNQENEEGRWPAFPEGDEHWIDGTRKTMAMILEQHEQTIQQGQQAIDQGDDKHGLELKQGKQGLAKGDQEMDHADERLKLDKQAAEEPASKDEARALLERLERLTTVIRRDLESAA